MRFRHVCLESVGYVLPAERITSDEIEARLAQVYERLHLPAGRLELMTGITERRFFPTGSKPGPISARAANLAIEASGIPRHLFGALIHGSVCRDQMEPATANLVHHCSGLPHSALVLDVSNACLGLLNGAVILAQMIEAGQIRAGLVVGTEVGRPLVEGTIDRLLRDENVTRKSIKLEFASLTIGSGSAAIVLCDEKLSRTGNRLLGGIARADTSHHELCAGGGSNSIDADGRPQMSTDSEALLYAGVALAEETWELTRRELGWTNDSVDKIVTHQVGKAHRQLLLDKLGLPLEKDFPTVQFLGNTGAAALPTAASLAVERGQIQAGDRVALLGIGSGLNSMMLGMHWQKTLI